MLKLLFVWVCEYPFGEIGKKQMKIIIPQSFTKTLILVLSNDL